MGGKDSRLPLHRCGILAADRLSVSHEQGQSPGGSVGAYPQRRRGSDSLAAGQAVCRGYSRDCHRRLCGTGVVSQPTIPVRISLSDVAAVE